MSTKISLHFIEVDGMSIGYEWLQKEVKNLNLRIRGDGTVTVSSPIGVELKEIESFLHRRKNFVLNTLRKSIAVNFSDFRGKQFVSGESYMLLGKALRLKIIQDARKQVTSDGVYLYLYTPETSNTVANGGMIAEYFEQKRNVVYHEVLNYLYPPFRKYNIKLPELRIEHMPKRWGSCTAAKGIIRLHPHLIGTPRPCVEYIVMHELCHLIHPNHSNSFYSLLSVMMPDWKLRQNMLAQYPQAADV